MRIDMTSQRQSEAGQRSAFVIDDRHHAWVVRTHYRSFRRRGNSRTWSRYLITSLLGVGCQGTAYVVEDRLETFVSPFDVVPVEVAS